MTLTTPDPRLSCSCGEIGEVRPDDDGGFRVYGRRDGLLCCMTKLGATAEDAIAHWAAMNSDVER